MVTRTRLNSLTKTQVVDRYMTLQELTSDLITGHAEVELELDEDEIAEEGALRCIDEHIAKHHDEADEEETNEEDEEETDEDWGETDDLPKENSKDLDQHGGRVETLEQAIYEIASNLVASGTSLDRTPAIKQVYERRQQAFEEAEKAKLEKAENRRVKLEARREKIEQELAALGDLKPKKPKPRGIRRRLHLKQ